MGLTAVFMDKQKASGLNLITGLKRYSLKASLNPADTVSGFSNFCLSTFGKYDQTTVQECKAC